MLDTDDSLEGAGQPCIEASDTIEASDDFDGILGTSGNDTIHG